MTFSCGLILWLLNYFKAMRVKLYKVRSLTVENGKNTTIDLALEFEGSRAFAIWDSIPVGDYQFTARLELDPRLLQEVFASGCDFFYRGQLVLPQPENN